MSSIRYRQNYKHHVYTKSDSGLIPALLRNGEFAFRPFGGFLPFEDDEEYQLVKLVNLTAYTVEKNGVEVWEDIRSGYYVLGCYRYGAYFILERNNGIFALEK
ncbi:conserved hypothetical protein [Vibrio coralliirubri]|uniref:Uncharacterized protein n=1 Tax=Vibrio coralliirubri TaxID=1516159 RepID=A0AA86X0X4_9VIBR|nr:hypothetical protein [Vibrio coralliirubri]CDT72377.1 conserved hypothetical protein [Vibrio coralliirubri]